MNSNPKNPPEHSGDCAYYPIPSTGVGRLDRRGKTAVVVGAGPGGLTTALTIKDEGYENVIVFEKRSVFSRMNVVNLHPESLHIFERLNLMDRFLERARACAPRAASRIARVPFLARQRRFEALPGMPARTEPLARLEHTDGDTG